MKALLILRHIKVENANAIAGLTYGFPPMSAFLGFTHALSRKLLQEVGVSLGGCAVVCHNYQVHAYQPGGWGDYVFALTRNPLTKEAQTPAFVEEGRMNMDVSLIIECDFLIDDVEIAGLDEEDCVERFEALSHELALTQRLAGGTMLSIESVRFDQVAEETSNKSKQDRRILLGLLPGTALIDRTSLVNEHHQNKLAEDRSAEYIDSWLEFFALKREAVPASEESDAAEGDQKADWQYLPKPAKGWLSPIAVGYRAISPLYENHQVTRTRDDKTPFRFVELVYGLGQWISPHRVRSVRELIWHHQTDGEWYLCQNKA